MKSTNESTNYTPEDSSSESEVVQISAFSFYSLLVGISLAAYLVALDRTIIANAIPFITNDFNSPNDAGWYGSAVSLSNPHSMYLRD